MNKSNFLPGFRDESLRERLWELFQRAEIEAKGFALRPEDWVEIVEVREQQAGGSWWDGRITTEANWKNQGVIFHEIFHSAFHKFPLHDGGADERWGDAFCDAFRYFMERESGVSANSEWFRKVAGYVKHKPNWMLLPPRELSYEYPASLIVAAVNDDYLVFRRLWGERLAERTGAGHSILDRRFGYSIPA